MSAFESETIIRFDEESKDAILYTASMRVAKILAYRGIEPDKVYKDNNGEVTGWEYEFPKSAVRIRPGKKLINIGGRTSKKSPN